MFKLNFLQTLRYKEMAHRIMSEVSYRHKTIAYQLFEMHYATRNEAPKAVSSRPSWPS